MATSVKNTHLNRIQEYFDSFFGEYRDRKLYQENLDKEIGSNYDRIGSKDVHVYLNRLKKKINEAHKSTQIPTLKEFEEGEFQNVIRTRESSIDPHEIKALQGTAEEWYNSRIKVIADFKWQLDCMIEARELLSDVSKELIQPVRIIPLKVHHLSILSSAIFKYTRQKDIPIEKKQISELLAALFVKTGHEPYSAGKIGRPDWRKVNENELNQVRDVLYAIGDIINKVANQEPTDEKPYSF